MGNLLHLQENSVNSLSAQCTDLKIQQIKHVLELADRIKQIIHLERKEIPVSDSAGKKGCFLYFWSAAERRGAVQRQGEQLL